jgi:hypothetical protein
MFSCIIGELKLNGLVRLLKPTSLNESYDLGGRLQEKNCILFLIDYDGIVSGSALVVDRVGVF